MGFAAFAALLVPLGAAAPLDPAAAALAPSDTEQLAHTDVVNAFESNGAPQVLRLLHIPKTAVSSLCEELQSVRPKDNKMSYCMGDDVVSWTRETCLNTMLKEPSIYLATMLREPRGLVLSQYLEAAYDEAWHPNASWPGPFEHGAFSEHRFREWLDYFNRDGGEDQWRPDKGDFNGYTPWNMISRILTCDATDDEHDEKSHHVFDLEQLSPSLTLAAEQLRKVDFVGVVELYDEALCILMLHFTGKLPVHCNCDDLESGEASKGHIVELHGLPSVKVASLRNDTIEQMDKYTLIDQAVYLDGVGHMIHELCSTQQATGTRLICDARIAKLKATGSYISGLAARVDDAVSACKQVGAAEGADDPLLS